MAQLVARLVRNEKVRGSNPLSSTIVVLHETPPNLICVLPSGRLSWRVFVLPWLWVLRPWVFWPANYSRDPGKHQDFHHRISI